MAKHPTTHLTTQGNDLSIWNMLLLIPFIALLWVPFYSSFEPALWGISAEALAKGFVWKSGWLRTRSAFSWFESYQAASASL